MSKRFLSRIYSQYKNYVIQHNFFKRSSNTRKDIESHKLIFTAQTNEKPGKAYKIDTRTFHSDEWNANC